MKKEENQKSRRRVNKIAWIAIGLFASGLVGMTVCGVLGELGYGDFLWPKAGMGLFFLFGLPAVILLLTVAEDVFRYDREDKQNKYAKTKLYAIEHFPMERFEAFLTKSYAHYDGMYRTKRLSLTRDAVCYYFAAVECVGAARTVKAQSDKLRSFGEKSGNVALIVILKTDTAKEADLKAVREIGKSMYIEENIRSRYTYRTTIPAVYESATGKLRFFYVDKRFDNSIYKLGCKALIRLAKQL